MAARNLYWINFFLIVTVIFLAIKTHEEWTSPVPDGKAVTEQKKRLPASHAAVTIAEREEVSPPSSYALISEKNLFSRERKEFPPPLPPQTPPARPGAVKRPPVRPAFTLFGVIVGKDTRVALLNDPASQLKSGKRRSITVRIGDQVGDYQVADILEDRITMKSAEESFEVLLYDPDRSKKRAVMSSSPSTPQKKPGVSRATSPLPRRSIQTPGASTKISPSSTGVAGRDLLRQRLEQRRLRQLSKRPPPVSDEEDEEEDEEDE